jgi:hypothetical protein
VATRKRLQSRDVASDSRAKDSADDHGGLLRCRSRDRVVHLADRRRFASRPRKMLRRLELAESLWGPAYLGLQGFAG